MLDDAQRVRLNNLVSALKQVMPVTDAAFGTLSDVSAIYLAFQQSGLNPNDIEDVDFVGDNAYVTRADWDDFIFALNGLLPEINARRVALLGILDTLTL